MVDAKDLGPGKHSLPVTYQVKEGITLQGVVIVPERIEIEIEE